MATYAFDLEAAIDAIATLEAAISTPSPGVITAYGYGENPAEITLQSVLPAVVHMPQGPQTVDGAGGRATLGRYALTYDIISTLLIVEVVPDNYPADEAGASLFWKPIAQTFHDKLNRLALMQAAGAHSYDCLFEGRSYQVRQWPPLPTPALHYYYSIEYTHRFMFYGS